MNRLLRVLEPQQLENHSGALGVWLEATSDLGEKLNADSVHKLLRVFHSCRKWRYSLLLMSACPSCLLDVPAPQVCQTLSAAIAESGASLKAMNIIEKLSSQQTANISMDVRTAVYT